MASRFGVAGGGATLSRLAVVALDSDLALGASLGTRCLAFGAREPQLVESRRDFVASAEHVPTLRSARRGVY